MDEAAHLRAIVDSNYDDEVIREYAEWLAVQNDPRAEFVHRKLDNRIAQRRLSEIAAHYATLDRTWIDQIFPQFVTAPMTGVFYAAPRPDAPPYVKIGDICSPDTPVCLIEQMKMFNEIPAEYYGYVAEILVSNEQPVAFGQRLFRIASSSPGGYDW